MLSQFIDDSSIIVFSAIPLYLKGLYDANVATTQRTSLWLSCSKWPISLITKTRHCQIYGCNYRPPLDQWVTYHNSCVSLKPVVFWKILKYTFLLDPWAAYGCGPSPKKSDAHKKLQKLQPVSEDVKIKLQVDQTIPECSKVYQMIAKGSQFTHVLGYWHGLEGAGSILYNGKNLNVSAWVGAPFRRRQHQRKTRSLQSLQGTRKGSPIFTDVHQGSWNMTPGPKECTIILGKSFKLASTIHLLLGNDFPKMGGI